ncbi:hypothetical protein BT69DRAFT_1277732 [Atractiella rhizophila]|nr:hypothetical protein BT69DRAFT_1277732 [Atractiella rhizophila]
MGGGPYQTVATFFAKRLATLDLNRSIDTLALRGPYTEGADLITTYFPALKPLHLDSSHFPQSDFGSKLPISRVLPSIRNLAVVLNPFDSEENRWGLRIINMIHLQGILDALAGSLEFLSIRQILNFGELDAILDSKPLRKLKTLELIDAPWLNQGYSYPRSEFPPLDLILQHFSSSSAETLFLDQLPTLGPPYPLDCPHLPDTFDKTFQPRNEALRFERKFALLRHIRSRFWEYVLHALKHQKMSGGWTELRRVRLGPYASRMVLTDGRSKTFLENLEEVGVMVSVYQQSEMALKM